MTLGHFNWSKKRKKEKKNADRAIASKHLKKVQKSQKVPKISKSFAKLGNQAPTKKFKNAVVSLAFMPFIHSSLSAATWSIQLHLGRQVKGTVCGSGMVVTWSKFGMLGSPGFADDLGCCSSKEVKGGWWRWGGWTQLIWLVNNSSCPHDEKQQFAERDTRTFVVINIGGQLERAVDFGIIFKWAWVQFFGIDGHVGYCLVAGNTTWVVGWLLCLLFSKLQNWFCESFGYLSFLQRQGKPELWSMAKRERHKNAAIQSGGKMIDKNPLALLLSVVV